MCVLLGVLVTKIVSNLVICGLLLCWSNGRFLFWPFVLCHFSWFCYVIFSVAFTDPSNFHWVFSWRQEKEASTAVRKLAISWQQWIGYSIPTDDSGVSAAAFDFCWWWHCWVLWCLILCALLMVFWVICGLSFPHHTSLQKLFKKKLTIKVGI